MNVDGAYCVGKPDDDLRKLRGMYFTVQKVGIGCHFLPPRIVIKSPIMGEPFPEMAAVDGAAKEWFDNMCRRNWTPQMDFKRDAPALATFERCREYARFHRRANAPPKYRKGNNDVAKSPADLRKHGSRLNRCLYVFMEMIIRFVFDKAPREGTILMILILRGELQHIDKNSVW